MVLHIANDFSGSKVYRNLVHNLDNRNIEQIVYTAVRSEGLIGKNSVDFKNKSSKIIYSNLLNGFTDRVFFKSKINKTVRDIESKIDMKKVKMIHAHTWYSDGGVAYLLSEKYNIPYIVSIRSTDTKLFYKYMFHLKSFGIKVLKNCKTIFVLNYNFDNELSKMSNGIFSKRFFLPNGVDDFWLNTFKPGGKVYDGGILKGVYVGAIIPRKNLLNLMKAVIKLNNDYGRIVVLLEIVGSGKGEYYDKVMNLSSKYSRYFLVRGRVEDKENLKNIYSNNDLFILPANNETFGLVYIEALLNHLPIICLKGEGISGIYKEDIGFELQSSSVDIIYQVLERIVINGIKVEIPYESILKNHSWSRIANVCIEKYKD